MIYEPQRNVVLTYTPPSFVRLMMRDANINIYLTAKDDMFSPLAVRLLAGLHEGG